MNTMEREKLFSDMRVGAIALSALAIIITGVGLAGGAKELFLTRTSPVTALLQDVNGLKKGAAVTMGGMTIGEVKALSFHEGQGLIKVDMVVRADMRPRIRKNSEVSVRTQGMLGDRYVEISHSGEKGESLPEGEALVGYGTANFDDTLTQARLTFEEANKMLSAVNDKQGTVGNFIYDSGFYENLNQAMEELKVLLDDFQKHPKKYVKLSIF